MFEKIKAKLKELQEKGVKQVDTSQFNDPVAVKTDWQTLKAGGANFKTHTLLKISSSVYRYQLSIGGKLFLGFFGLIGIVALFISAYMFVNGEIVDSLFPLFLGSVCTGLAFFAYKVMGVPKVFDASLEFFWVGHKQPQFSGDHKSNQKLIYFSEIHALQILSERVSSKNSSYDSYEINLVMQGGSRLNVVDHGNLAQIIVDAEILSELMGKPVWDISN